MSRPGTGCPDSPHAVHRLRLTEEEETMLVGEKGLAVKKAMEIITALGKIYGATDLVAVTSVQIAGVSFKNLGDAGLEFLNEWAEEGARTVVPATLNPAGMDLARWQELGIPESFAHSQLAVIEAFRRMGIDMTLTCTPYLVHNRPPCGEHIAWSESSAVCFANSVLGARTNREGGPSALAAAITGRTARFGLHLEQNRRASHEVNIRCAIRSEADIGALGAMTGIRVGEGIPFFRNLDLSWAQDREDALKVLGAALAASGAVAMYHVEDITPEAGTAEWTAGLENRILITDLLEGYAMLDSPLDKIDFVSLGCPHASLDEIRQIANWLRGKQVNTLLWVTTSRHVRDEAQRRGLVQMIEEAGGHVVADTCLVVAPVEALGVHSLATNSAKAALYARSHSGLETRFGSTGQCLEAAVSGIWGSGYSS